MLKTETIQDIIVVRFDNVNRFNALIAEPVKEQLKEYFNKPKTKLILNLENIDFVDSTGKMRSIRHNSGGSIPYQVA